MPAGKNQSAHADIVIAGGGIAGLALACILGQKGVDIHVIEPFPPSPLKDTKSSGRTIALMQTSLNVMKAAGLEAFCVEYGTPMHTMRIMDDSVGGRNMLECAFDATEIGLEFFGRNIPNAPLRAALYEQAQSIKTITFHKNKLADFTVNDAHAHIALEEGVHIDTPLLIGMDGRGSLVRKIAGIKIWQKDYGQSAITCIINHSRAHQNISTEFHRPGGPFALVPLKGNQSSVVWVDKTDKIDEYMRLSKQAFVQALQERSADILGGITLETPPESWPLKSIRAKSFIAPRVAIAAEAAHVISPITAQGLNLSLRDVAALAEIIFEAMKNGIDHGSQTILETYEQRRRADITTRVGGVNGFNALVSSENTIIRDLRRSALNLVDHIGPLRQWAMINGLAPSLNQGSLLKTGTL